MTHPCIECGLRYSSYCIGCKNEKFGIGALPIVEKPERVRQKRSRKDLKIDKTGKDCKYR